MARLVGKEGSSVDREGSAGECMLCPRRCRAKRGAGQKGYCGADDRIMVARAAIHMWEEPCISGTNGSGAVFFCGCPLHCIYCQNHEISDGGKGEAVSIKELAEIFLSLQEQGAHNINLVTAGHYAPQVVKALRTAKEGGLTLPIVWNSSGYERTGMLKMLEGLVDIYLPDFKYLDPELAGALSHAPDYPAIAMAALEEMVRQTQKEGNVFSEDGQMKKGIIVRHLLLPGHVKHSLQVVEYLLKTYGSRIWISLMSQYTPMPAVQEDPLLGRRVTKREYDRLVRGALEMGLEQGFIQEGDVARESFIPAFDHTGIKI